MKDIKCLILLSNASWATLFFAWFFLYHGMHTNNLINSVVFFYASFLMIFYNIPLLIGLLMKFINHKEVMMLETLHLVIKLGVACYIFLGSGV